MEQLGQPDGNRIRGQASPGGMALGAACFSFLLTFGSSLSAAEQAWTFTDITAEAGIVYAHGYVEGLTSERRMVAGGVAAGDVDGDGFVDLYVVRGNLGPNLLFHNQGDGTFEEIGSAAGVALEGLSGSGPLLADFDGDGRLDLFVGGVEGTPLRMFRNLGPGGLSVVAFEDRTADSGLSEGLHTCSAAAADYDLDGDLDLFLSQWLWNDDSDFLWRNDGNGTFVDVGATDLPEGEIRNSFSPTFVDLDQDSWPDLVLASDFGTSEVFRNEAGIFSRATSAVISDENGMGSAVGDFDNDGDFDWFVSSIWDPDGIPDGGWEVSGNRLYRYDASLEGFGVFEDVTDIAGVREGFWGWGSCFADFDLDGDLDLFHVNGYQAFPIAGIGQEFLEDPSRFFLNNGDGTFTEVSGLLGLDDTDQGRGIACFDLERDGDVDIFIGNNSQPPRLYRNELPSGGTFLTVKVAGGGLPGNSQGIGLRVEVEVETQRQIREIRAGSNYASQNPAEAHFGLGGASGATEVRIIGPEGVLWRRRDVAANQILVVGSVDLVFQDGFETGSPSQWSEASP